MEDNGLRQREQDDHDLLIELRGEIKSIREDIQSLRKDIVKQVDDHEGRIRKLETWGAMAIGALTLLQIIFKFLIK